MGTNSIGVFQAIVDLHKNSDGYRGTVHVPGVAGPFDGAPPEIADAISDATRGAEEAGEVEELDLPGWCSVMEVADV